MNASFANCKFAHYQFIDSFELYHILENLWNITLLTKKINIQIFNHTYHEDCYENRFRLPMRNIGTFRGNKKKFSNLNFVCKYPIYSFHIKLLKEKEECWKRIMKKVFKN